MIAVMVERIISINSIFEVLATPLSEISLICFIASWVVTFLFDRYFKSFCVAHVSHITFKAVEVELHSPVKIYNNNNNNEI